MPLDAQGASDAVNKTLLFVVNVDTFFVSHRFAIAKAARDAGYEVHVATAVTQCETRITEAGFKLHRLPIERSSIHPVAQLRLLKACYRLMIQLKPDIVHLVTAKPVLIGGLAARLATVPAVVAAISGLGYMFTANTVKARLLKPIAACLYRLALKHPRICVICQNPNDQMTVQRLARLSLTQMVLIPGSGVDLTQYAATALPERPRIVLLPARILADKGVYEFATAAANLRGKHQTQFVLAGKIDPDNPSHIPQKTVQSWVADGRLQWWGECADMPSVLAKSYLVVLPSYREGLPRVLCEAAACARPVITTDVPGCRDAIIADKTGMLVPARNAKALTEAIGKLLDAEKTCQAMGQAGRAWAEKRFDIQPIVEQHLRIYAALFA